MRIVSVCAALVLGLSGGLTTVGLAEEDAYSAPTCCQQTRSLCDACARCDDCAECCDSFNGRKRILGLLPSDHCFDSFISPISNPFFFEDPRSLTEFRGIFIDNDLPPDTGSGDAQVWAAQFRGRITDRFSVIAPRLAYFSVRQADEGAPHGFLSAPVGFKYNFFRDVDNQFLASAGMTYFIPGNLGNDFPLRNGDYHFYLTGGKQIFGRGHWLSGTGFRLPENRNWGTQLWYWSNQWDYQLPGNIYPLIGLNWFHWMDSAHIGADIPVTSIDLINLPSSGVGGRNVVTNVLGAKWKPGGHFELGFGWEFPLTVYKDVLQNRVYADVIFRY